MVGIEKWDESIIEIIETQSYDGSENQMKSVLCSAMFPGNLRKNLLNPVHKCYIFFILLINVTFNLKVSVQRIVDEIMNSLLGLQKPGHSIPCIMKDNLRLLELIRVDRELDQPL